LIRAIIFDFDGLIVDTEVPAYQAWEEIYQSYGCHLPLSTWVTCIGGSADIFSPYAYLEEQLGHPIERKKIRSKYYQRYIELVEMEPILPGVKDYIDDAKRLGLKVALASSSSHSWVDGHLSRLGLIAHFDCIKCSEDVKAVKPDPALYQSILDELELRADEGIVLEDSANGILAAKRAGLFCVAVPNPMTCHLSLDLADLQLTSLADLPLEEIILQVQKNSGNDKLTLRGSELGEQDEVSLSDGHL
jgi:HAD superfamily hydrolase (TIGR01509 family)